MTHRTSPIDLRAFYPPLEGMRCLAMALVLLSHWIVFTRLGAVSVLLGVIGVTIFFVLTGFFITRILLAQKEDTGKGVGSDLGAFYGRRALRVLPLYLGMIAVGYLLAIPNVREEWWTLLSFRQNVPGEGLGLPASGLYRIFWSLSAQVHFYLLFPLLVIIVPFRHMRFLFVLLLLAGILSRVGIYLTDYSLYHKKWAANNTSPACLDAFALGALLAWYHSYQPEQLKRWISRPVIAFGSLLFFGVIAVASVLYLFDPVVNCLLRLASAIFACWLMARLLLLNKKDGLEWIFTRQPVRYLGRISYGIYVYQAFIPLVFGYAGIFNHLFRFSIPVFAVIYSLMTVLAAALSWELLEKPLGRLKWKWPYTAKDQLS